MLGPSLLESALGFGGLRNLSSFPTVVGTEQAFVAIQRGKREPSPTPSIAGDINQIYLSTDSDTPDEEKW